MTMLSMMHQNPATALQAMHSMFSAGAHGAANQAWIEINRPLTALALNAPLAGATTGNQLPGGTATGGILVLPTVSLPIGMDIKSVTCTAQDVDNGWQVLNFTFGTLNLVNPQGTFGGVNLSMFDPRLQHVDRLAPWILSKTKVDVQVTAQLQNGAFFNSYSGVAGAGLAAVFHGFSLNAFQEEQVCAIQTRIEPTDRNIGNAELINHFRQIVGAALNLQIPAHQQAPAQIGRVAIARPPIGPNFGVIGGVQAPHIPPVQAMQPVLRTPY
jgi:hypothetical protein